MGTIHDGAPHDLVLQLREQFSLRNFVETGTYMGGTSVWAASHFEQVITVEASDALYNETVSKYGEIPNIEFILGNSKDVLAKVVPTLQSATLFWIDSHWSMGNTFGVDDQCPVLREIEIINASPHDHFLLIDDARMFTSPPVIPLSIAAWPPIDQLIDAMRAGAYDKYIVIFEDVIVGIPEATKSIMAPWFQEAVTHKGYQEAVTHIPGRFKRGVGLISQGSELLVQSAIAKMHALISR